jgi:D-alanyl-D-alanine carboxypeptidase
MAVRQRWRNTAALVGLLPGVGLAGLAVLCVGGGCRYFPESGKRSRDMQMDATRVASLSRGLQALLDDLVQGEENVRSGLLLVEGPAFKFKGASGVAFESAGLPMLPDDQFTIDSVAKTLTATIVMKLVESGRLGLDDPIREHLPASLVSGLHVFHGRSYSDEITVRHLLNHTSGIPDDWSCADFLDRISSDLQRRWRPEETIEFVKSHCAPVFPPGGGFSYSDTGYNLLGLVIEGVTGEPLHEAFRHLLLDPLGMDHTYRPAYEAPRASIPGRPPSERYLDDLECSLSPAVMTADWGGGGLVSTTEDLDRFLRAFVENRIFSKGTTRDQMFDWVDSGPFHGYGFGVGLVDYDRSGNPLHAGLGQIWGHAGSSQVFMYYWPKQDVVMVGTLNQLDSQRDRYDVLASIMRTVQSWTALGGS